MKTPCDEAVIGSRAASLAVPRQKRSMGVGRHNSCVKHGLHRQHVVNVALPALQANFGANVVDVQWVIESYGLTLAALILVGGSMGDLFGRRLMFLLGVIVFAIASATVRHRRQHSVN